MGIYCKQYAVAYMGIENGKLGAPILVKGLPLMTLQQAEDVVAKGGMEGKKLCVINTKSE